MRTVRASPLLALSALAIAGCASSSLVQDAQRGDQAALRTDVAAREKAGALSNGEAARVARAVVAWDLAHAPDAAAAVTRVEDVRACAAEVDDALADRARTHDAAGGFAALARADAQTLSPGAARDHAGDAIDAWRAVGARGLVRDQDEAERRRALVDPAPSVRRAAIRAAIDAAHDGAPTDVAVLADAAQHDPEPLLRSDAVRALGAVGGDAAFRALRDLWVNADAPMRQDIARAYASPGLRGVGGAGELRVLVAQGEGGPSIEAAAAVLRGSERNAELDASATAVLTRFVAQGTERDRLHAVAVAPATPGPLLDALRAAAKDRDASVREAALARLAQLPSDRDASIAALEALAQDRDRVALASRARLALATAGDARAQAWLEGDLASPDPFARVGAASGLAALGREGRAAPLLADSEASVRDRAACVILLRARARR